MESGTLAVCEEFVRRTAGDRRKLEVDRQALETKVGSGLVFWRRLFLGLVLLVVSGIFTSAEAQFGNGYDIIFTSDQAGTTQTLCFSSISTVLTGR